MATPSHPYSGEREDGVHISLERVRVTVAVPRSIPMTIVRHHA